MRDGIRSVGICHCVGRSEVTVRIRGAVTSLIHCLITCPILLLSSLFVHATESTEVVAEPEGFWSGPINAPVPATIRGGKVVHTPDIETLREEQNALLVDVSNTPKRPEGMAIDAPWLPLPHETIPGTIWIPDVGMPELSKHMDEFFQAQLIHITDNDLNRALIIYCHERCWLSWNAAKRAIGYGYRNVLWNPEGIEGWRAAGLPTEVAKPRLPPQN
jgi:PQQ-dependent catabolism-associated CXXCW motif protein